MGELNGRIINQSSMEDLQQWGAHNLDIMKLLLVEPSSSVLPSSRSLLLQSSSIASKFRILLQPTTPTPAEETVASKEPIKEYGSSSSLWSLLTVHSGAEDSIPLFDDGSFGLCIK